MELREYWQIFRRRWWIPVTLVMLVMGFFFSAVASYIVGLVGSSNSPVSGMTICTVLLTSGLLLVLGFTGEAGMLATLGVAATTRASLYLYNTTQEVDALCEALHLAGELFCRTH